LSGFAKAKLLLNEKRLDREKMSVKWQKGPALAGTDFGNPLSDGGTAYTVCVYGDGNLAGSYVVDRAGGTCAGRPCWKSTGGDPPTNRGYSYSDRLTTADGIQKMQMKGGDAGRAKLSVKGRNNGGRGQLSLPVGVAAEMAGSSQATIQLFGVDAPAPGCFTATLGEIQKDDGTQFKARN
jgi:hypothetical protein